MKFSIRDLILVTVIVALLVGWWIDRTRLVHELQEKTTAAESQRLANEWLLGLAKQQRDRAESVEKLLRELKQSDDRKQ